MKAALQKYDAADAMEGFPVASAKRVIASGDDEIASGDCASAMSEGEIATRDRADARE